MFARRTAAAAATATEARAAAASPHPRRSPPRSVNDGGLLAKLVLPAHPWKEPTDRNFESVRRGLPSTPRQGRARPATAASAAVANARAAATS